MKRKGIKNLIVDFGGVLIDLDRQRCLENFRELGLPDVEHTLDLYHQQDFFQQYEKGLISSADFRNVIREKIGKDVDDARIDAAWNSFLVSIPTNEIHWKWSCEHAFPYKTFRVEDYFEHIFLSYEMKMAKPDEEIFRKVLDDAGLDPKETFFIDDSEANCMTARSLGISTYVPKAGEDWSHLFK